MAFSDHEEWTPEDRREDAAELFEGVRPFASVSFATEPAAEEYVAAMASRGVVNFGSRGIRPASFFTAFPTMVWSYLPSAEQVSVTYGDYVCNKVVGGAPVLAGDGVRARTQLENGGRRKLGLLSTTDPDWRGLIRLAELVREKVGACGGAIEAEGAFPSCCLAHDGGEDPSYAVVQMAQFQVAGVTTVLWPGGINGNYGKAAKLLGYEPEWIIAGDGTIDANWPVTVSLNTAAFDGRAVVVTPRVVEGSFEDHLCNRFYGEIDADTPEGDLVYTCAFYPDLHQMFVGFQVAGPFLDPTNLDKGFAAIPHRLSGDPTVPACFYEVGDYTCVKDAQAEIWDAAGMPPGETRFGCWRSIDGGSRYRPAGDAPRPWPSGNIDAQVTGAEACNGSDSRARFNIL